jgi:UPF0755 protein
VLRIILVLFVLALLAGAALYAAAYTSYKGYQNEVFVEFPRGTTTSQMADRLAEQGVIRYPWQFMAVRATRPRALLQAGEYRFQEAASAAEVFDRIVRGDIYHLEVTIPEGSNIFDIAGIMESAGVMTGADFLQAAADVSPLKEVAPTAQTLEGYLFPSKYRITRNTTAQQFTRRMVDQFFHQWKSLTDGMSPAPNLHDTVTLASLVEKETGVASERPMVASVYANRLRIGMKLDCDPTTIYAAMLEHRYRGKIHRSDLANKHAYNTYQNPGLPPGPITNPGLASMKAALSPAQSEFFFFVAKPDGSGAHQFSVDYAAHLRAVAEYRRGQANATGSGR